MTYIQIEVNKDSEKRPLMKKIIKAAKNQKASFNYGKIKNIYIIKRISLIPHLRAITMSKDGKFIFTGIDVGIKWIEKNLQEDEKPEYIAIKLQL